MKQTDHDRGYQACLDGVLYDTRASDAWKAGWNAADKLRQGWLDLCDTSDFFA
jgi:hypothetical protein